MRCESTGMHCFTTMQCDAFCRYEANREFYTYSLDRRVALLVKAVERGGPSHQVPIHAFNGDRDGGEFLLDMTVQEDILMTEFKQKLAERLREDGPEAYRECVGEHLRVRECGYSVFMDHQTVIEAVKNFAGGERFAVSLLGGPETKTESSQSVLSLYGLLPLDYRLPHVGC